MIELKIEKDGEPAGSFQWVTGLQIKGKTAWEFAQTGRNRWKIENEGFNIQKNHRYNIEHANSGTISTITVLGEIRKTQRSLPFRAETEQIYLTNRLNVLY